jgi:hypothetical protein
MPGPKELVLPMPTQKRIPEEPPSEELVLAAIDRASRHRRNERPGVLLSSVKQHLGLARHGGITRRLRPTWVALQTAGLIEKSRRQGLTLWGLTSAGVRRLQAAEQGGQLEALPESPQHRDWREARGAAVAHIDRLRDELRAALANTASLLDAQQPADSDAWYEVSRTLKKACCHLGSATHCLCEWPEPTDARADITPEEYRGRRDYRRWADVA